MDLNKKAGTADIPADIAGVVRNHGGGHYNHTFFWSIMAPPASSNGPSAELKGAIEAAFGSVDEMKAKFNAAAAGVFGSGWAWLVAKPDGTLAITGTPNQDNPLQAALVQTAGIPVLGLDVWEHGYYLKYQASPPLVCVLMECAHMTHSLGPGRRRPGGRPPLPPPPTRRRRALSHTPPLQNRRPEYIAAWWNVVNWERASQNYAAALKGEAKL